MAAIEGDCLITLQAVCYLNGVCECLFCRLVVNSLFQNCGMYFLDWFNISNEVNTIHFGEMLNFNHSVMVGTAANH